MRVLRQSGFLRTRWKNGGGETLQVAIWPAHATIDDFDWRISLSTVVADGAFSRFPGIDRTLCLVVGVRIDLMIDGIAVSLSASHNAHRFAGEAECFATVPAGPIADLNVMTRRTRFAHQVANVREGAPLGDQRRERYFVAARDCAARSGGQLVALAPQDALFLDSGEAAALESGAGWLIDFTPVR